MIINLLVQKSKKPNTNYGQLECFGKLIQKNTMSVNDSNNIPIILDLNKNKINYLTPSLASTLAIKSNDVSNDNQLLESSIIKNDKQTVKYLLDKYKARLPNLVESSFNHNYVNSNDIPQLFFNILHVSIENNAIDVIKTCIKSGIDPNKPTNNILLPINCKYCNLIRRNDNKKLVSKSNSLISDINEDLSTINYSSNSYLLELPPIYLSISKCNHEYTEYLLKHQACPNVQDKYGNTPLHLAVAKQHPCYKCIYLLIKYHAKSNLFNSRNQTPRSILKQFIYCKNLESSNEIIENWDYSISMVYSNLFTDIFKEIDLARLNQSTINSNNSKIKYTKKQLNENQKFKNNSDSNSSLLINKNTKSKYKLNDLDSKISSAKPLSLSLRNIAQQHYFSCNSLNIKRESNNHANNEFIVTKVSNNKIRNGFKNKMNLLKSNRFKSIKKKSNKNNNDSFKIPSLIIDDSSISSTCNQNQNNSISATSDSNNLSLPVFSDKSNKKSKSLTNVRGIFGNDLSTISQNNSEATTPAMTPKNLKKIEEKFKSSREKEKEKEKVSSINSVNKLSTKSSDHKKTFKKYSLVIIGSSLFSNNNNYSNKLQQQSNASNSSAKLFNNNLNNNNNNNNNKKNNNNNNN
jgi:hypothetical protein